VRLQLAGQRGLKMAVHAVAPSGAGGAKRKEIYKYEAPWTVYSMNWSVRPDRRFRLALGSFIEEYNNKVQLVSLDEDTSEFLAKSTFDHPYPTTKIMWIPDTKGVFPDLLATSGDYLRVWRAGEETRLECLLNNNKNSDFCAPLTSFDWNEVDPNLLGTSSIDTTCTIWGLEDHPTACHGGGSDLFGSRLLGLSKKFSGFKILPSELNTLALNSIVSKKIYR
ncbi:hypothetical protein V5799_022342, partial [Amblyomma americanum]